MMPFEWPPVWLVLGIAIAFGLMCWPQPGEGSPKVRIKVKPLSWASAERRWMVITCGRSISTHLKCSG